MKKNTKGSGLVEVVIVAAVLATSTLAIFGTFALLSRLHQRNMLTIKAELLAEEGIEALRFLKGGGWGNLSGLSGGQAKYLSLGVSTWSTTATPEVIDGAFYRTVHVNTVERDSSDNIVSSGGTTDPNTLLIDSSVAWSWRGATTTVTYKAYITNI